MKQRHDDTAGAARRLTLEAIAELTSMALSQMLAGYFQIASVLVAQYLAMALMMLLAKVERHSSQCR